MCSQTQTLPERGTLPIQCTRSNAAATGRFLTLYRKSNQPSSMYVCQVLAFLAGWWGLQTCGVVECGDAKCQQHCI